MPDKSYGTRPRSLLFYVTSFGRLLTPLSVDSTPALWASFCFRLYFFRHCMGSWTPHEHFISLNSGFWLENAVEEHV